MPIYYLNEKLVFPHPTEAEKGVLAIGGDLNPDRLILAYENGIFPWYNEDEPIIWHTPNPRFVLFPNDLKISKSMRQILYGKKYNITLNKDFEAVIKACRIAKRKNQLGTWIHDEVSEAYTELHRRGIAHSVEVWNKKNDLVGGLYGLNLGTVFYGESMFHTESNTSKLAFITLVQSFPFSVIDCQVHTKHLESLGAGYISRLNFLEKNVKESKKENLLARNTNFMGT
jgi:leucyl/phenylalanyl-tRNA--protein transferase